MKKYETYKNSGIEWIGEIPEGWATNRIKFLFSFGRGLSITKADLFESGSPVISYGQIHSKQNTGTGVDDSLLRFVPEEIAKNQKDSEVKIGDFIFADTSEDMAGCGNCVYVDREGIFAGYHSIIVDGKGRNNKYFAYLFKSDEWRAQIRSKACGVKVFSITQGILSECSVLVPPQEEQTTIAAYLDYKVGGIDKSTAAIMAQIEDLKAYRQSIINEAVTKGLNPDAKMKDSGIEWIGEIPEGWANKRLKYLVACNTEVLPESSDKDCIIKYVEISDVDYANGINNYSTISFGEAPSRARRITHQGDVIISTVRTYLRAIATIQEENLIVSTGFAVLSPKEKYILPEFLSYAVLSEYFVGSVIAHSKGVSYPAINSTDLMDLSILLPPINEQTAIASYLDAKTAQIDATIAALEAQANDLAAYKQSIISEAVTGKIDVRDWEPND